MSDPLLFTPGPLTTSATVKAAMQRDIGSRDREFIEVIANIRQELLELADVSQAAGYEAIPMQGSGTFGIEAVLGSVIPSHGKLLVLGNGAYGERMVQIAERLRIAVQIERWPEDQSPDAAIAVGLLADSAITHVAMVHLETTTGILNPIAEIAQAVQDGGRSFILDAMSSFGGVPIDLAQVPIDYLISSANKCLESVPGFSFVIARRTALEATAVWARSISLDLYAQWQALERNGQFRFTPPTHALLAFRQALLELRKEGGITARAERYRMNRTALLAGMQALSFREYLPRERQSDVITSFRYPADAHFNFDEFYRRLSARGFVIYPGKVSHADCFRIGTIGRITVEDVRGLVREIGSVLSELRVEAMSSGAMHVGRIWMSN